MCPQGVREQDSYRPYVFSASPSGRQEQPDGQVTVTILVDAIRLTIAVVGVGVGVGIVVVIVVVGVGVVVWGTTSAGKTRTATCGWTLVNE